MPVQKEAYSREVIMTSETTMPILLIWHGVVSVMSPVLVPEQDKNGMQLFQADRLACGVWKGNRVAL